jgi:hypothetical protein
MPNFVHSVMVLGNLVLLVSALGYVDVMIVVSGKLSECPTFESTCFNLGSIEGTGGRSTRSTHPRHPHTTPEGNTTKQIWRNQIRSTEI